MNLVVFTFFFTGWLVLMTDASCYRKYEHRCCKKKGWLIKPCTQYCPKSVWQCSVECRNVGKRSQTFQDVGDFSCNFASYDVKGNGKITYEEFVESQRMNKGTREAFNSADKNNDEALTCKELRKAPFEFACILNCPQSDDGQEDVEEMTD